MSLKEPHRRGALRADFETLGSHGSLRPGAADSQGKSSGYSRTRMTTRRFWARPSGVSLSASDWSSPKEITEIRESAT